MIWTDIFQTVVVLAAILAILIKVRTGPIYVSVDSQTLRQKKNPIEKMRFHNPLRLFSLLSILPLCTTYGFDKTGVSIRIFYLSKLFKDNIYQLDFIWSNIYKRFF